jgi:hypothetical protein
MNPDRGKEITEQILLKVCFDHIILAHVLFICRSGNQQVIQHTHLTTIYLFRCYQIYIYNEVTIFFCQIHNYICVSLNLDSIVSACLFWHACSLISLAGQCPVRLELRRKKVRCQAAA